MTDLFFSVIGGVVGFIIGGPTGAKIGWAIGSYVGSTFADPIQTEGPRLQRFSGSPGIEGVPIPIVFGTARVQAHVMWMGQVVEVATTTTQGGKGGGGKGAVSVIEYSYYATFAVGICEGPIVGIRRIWANGELIVTKSERATAEEVLGSLTMAWLGQGEKPELQSVVGYSGDEDQLPDPVMESFEGAGNVPSFRGLSYVVFEHLPLEKFGNRIPKIEVEILTTGTSAGMFEEVFPTTPFSWYHSEYGGYDYRDGVIFRSWWNATHVTLERYTVGGGLISSTALAHGVSLPDVDYINGLSGLATLRSLGVGSGPGALAWYDGVDVIASGAYIADNTDHYSAIRYARPVTLPDLDNGGGYIYTYGGDDSSTKRGWIARFRYEGGPGTYTVDNVADEFYLLHDSTLALGTASITVDRTTRKVYIVKQAGQPFSEFEPNTPDVQLIEFDEDLNFLRYWQAFPQAYGWPTRTPIVVVDGYLINQRVGQSTPGGGIFSSAPLPSTSTGAWTQTDIYTDVDSGGIFQIGSNVFLSGSRLLLLGNRYAQIPVSMETVVSNVCERAGLTALDYDVSSLTDSVRGYIIDRPMAARKMIEPLQRAFWFDAAETNGRIVFTKRGTSSPITIPDADLEAVVGTGDASALISSAISMGELPKQVRILFYNLGTDYLQGVQYSRRVTKLTEGSMDVQLPVVLNSDEAAQVAETLLYLAWLERDSYSFTLPPRYINLDPGDVVVVKGITMRITQMDLTPPGLLKIQAVREDPMVYSRTATGVPSIPSTGATPQLKGPTKMYIWDIPLLRDKDDDNGYYLGVGAYYAAWDGAVIYKSSDEGVSWNSLGAITDRVTHGTTAEALLSQPTYQWDNASSLTVTVSGIAPSSVTELAVYNGANAALVGDAGRWELVQFKDVAPGSFSNEFILTNFLRGRRGTDEAVSQHVAGEQIVILDTLALRRFIGELNLVRDFKAVTTGAPLVSSSKQEFTNTAVGLQPYTVTEVSSTRNGGGDVIIVWTRRTRVGGEWNDYVDVPLGEDSQSYEVVIYADATYTTEKRTLTGAVTETDTYTSADQITDFGSNQSTVYAGIFQMSATVGRGFEKRVIV